MNESSGNRVCVIGAGIAGLVTAKVLLEDGFDVTVFEKHSEPGGVWAASRTYPGLRANDSRDSYAFSDFPYPKGTDDFPTAEQVRSYLTSYADRFGVSTRLRLSTEVAAVSRARGSAGATGGFNVRVRSAGPPVEPDALAFDFVAVCNGVFAEPRLPEIAGRERFAGRVLHSSQLTDVGIVRHKRVVVIGAGKSALDCATCAAAHATSCSLVFRAPHWMMPRYLPGGVRADQILISRLTELMLPTYHRPSRAATTLHRVGGAFLRFFWRQQNAGVVRLLQMPPILRPETPLPSGFENIGVGNEFYEALSLGRVVPKRARVAAFAGADLVELDTGERLEADVVVLATGWHQSLPFLDPELHARVYRDGGFRLYRHILPPDEPRLGFVGYASSIACQLTSEIAAHWLSQCFRGELALPSVSEMDREIAHVRRWVEATFPARPEGYFVGPYLGHYLDELLSDMGLRTRRTSNVITEYLTPLRPTRYRTVGAERRRARRA